MTLSLEALFKHSIFLNKIVDLKLI